MQTNSVRADLGNLSPFIKEAANWSRDAFAAWVGLNSVGTLGLQVGGLPAFSSHFSLDMEE